MNTIHTVDTIKTLLETSNAAVERALQVIYERQTSDEQAIGTTKHENGVGFSGADAEILSSFACQVNSKVGQPDKYLGRPRKLGECLSPKQMALARKKISKYARQLLEASQEKAPQVVEPVKVLLSFHLMAPRQGWQEMTEERAKAWYDRMLKLATFYGHEANVLPWAKKAPGKFWINQAGELLQVLGVGEKPETVTKNDLDKKAAEDALILLGHQEERAKAVASKVNALAAEGRFEEGASLVLSWTDDADKAFDTWRDSVETLEDEPFDIKAEREMEERGLGLERAMWEMEARGDREGTLRDERAKFEARKVMEAKAPVKPGSSELDAIRSKISSWIAK